MTILIPYAHDFWQIQLSAHPETWRFLSEYRTTEFNIKSSIKRQLEVSNLKLPQTNEHLMKVQSEETFY